MKNKYEAELILFKIIGRNFDRYLYAANKSNILEKYYGIKKSYIKFMEMYLTDENILNNTWNYLYENIPKYYELHNFDDDSKILYHMKSDSEFLKKELHSNKKSFLNKIKNYDIKFVNECLKNKYLNINIYDNISLIGDKHGLPKITTHKCEITIAAIKRILKKVKNTPYWNILRVF